MYFEEYNSNKMPNPQQNHFKMNATVEVKVRRPYKGKPNRTARVEIIKKQVVRWFHRRGPKQLWEVPRGKNIPITK